MFYYVELMSDTGKCCESDEFFESKKNAEKKVAEFIEKDTTRDRGWTVYELRPVQFCQLPVDAFDFEGVFAYHESGSDMTKPGGLVLHNPNDDAASFEEFKEWHKDDWPFRFYVLDHIRPKVMVSFNEET